ncbi:MAG TPA: class I SAM-dependent methyltransferase [Candidatus Limnocylindrales bacterium]|nr:class I SAM-dependent methyltransferase [Candidatus Limnocylindrales bacterium]
MGPPLGQKDMRLLGSSAIEAPYTTLPPEVDVYKNSDLQDEVLGIREQGYDIEIAISADPAYLNPEKLRNVYFRIDDLSRQYQQRRTSLVVPSAGRNALGVITPAAKKQAGNQLEAAKEEIREDLLYGPVEGQAWHAQRGSATSLLTIQEAHRLSTESKPGTHDTMSAMLDESVLDHEFGPGSSLAGQSLREAVIQTGMRFYGKDPEVSAAYTDSKLDELREFIKTPATDAFKDIVGYCSDSLGIRNRKEIVREEIGDFVSEIATKDPIRKEITMLSVGCGTALPIYEVALDARKQGIESKLILLDQDPIALASAVVLARKLGLEDNIEIHCERLFSKFGKPLDMQKIMKGRQLDVIEDSGLREYLPDRIYKALAKESWKTLSPGGLMTSGNMNSNRPQPAFLHGLMGWVPKVQMRSIQECLDLHAKAGVPAEAMKMRVTEEGVYTVYASRKSKKY